MAGKRNLSRSLVRELVYIRHQFGKDCFRFVIIFGYEQLIAQIGLILGGFFLFLGII